MKQYVKRLSATGLSLTFALSSLAAFSVPTFAQSNSGNDNSRYIASLHPLNHSGVTGFANLSLNSQQPGASLMATVNARGTEPSQIHAIHIHGKLDAEDAECPTITADTNKDRIVSVFEGAPFYGPIKVSFTDPITPFGPPANTTLFAPFAGAPVLNNFPHADNMGKVSYDKTIPFDQSNQYAVQALASLAPLNDQHIVIHGGYAPESVDTMGGDPNKIVYDPLLPVACGSIVQTHRGSSNSNQNNGGQNSGTGPDSDNQTNQTTTNTTTVTNNNRVGVNAQTNQNSQSGDASVVRNTRGGSADSGSATNNSSNSFFIRLMNMGIFRN